VTTVAIVEDHPIFRQGLAHMIEEAILGDLPVERHPVHAGAVRPGQREIEEVSNHRAALGSQVGGRHAFHPERQRVVDHLLS